MPTYSYQCQQCQAVTELVHGMRETQRPACPHCGGLTRRIIRGTPAILKGAQTGPAEESPPAPDGHDCGSGCVLHRKKPPPNSR